MEADELQPNDTCNNFKRTSCYLVIRDNERNSNPR